MNIPRGPLDILLYAIILTGAVGYIGLLAVAAEFVPISYPWGKYSSHALGVMGDCCIAAIIISIVCGIALAVFWFLARPSSSFKLALIFRILIAVCIVAELIVNIVCVYYSDTYTTNKDNKKAKSIRNESPEKQQDYLKWITDTFSKEGTYDKMLSLNRKYVAFLCLNLIFATLSSVYWCGFLLGWFGESGSGSDKPKSEKPKSDKKEEA